MSEPTNPPVTDLLHDYLVARDTARLNRVAEMWNGLTEREQRLVKEAAVMGYVRGTMAGRDVSPFPRDRDIVIEVLSCTDGHDLYPTLAALPGQPGDNLSDDEEDKA
ncbi:hypothetical protein [Nocardioides pakistanensis]